jgi:thioredoxin-dependent peroxiredoxin
MSTTKKAAAKSAAPATKPTKKPAAAPATKKNAPAATTSLEPIAVGQPAPAFSITADDGKTISLSDFAGKRVVLYFYPKDNTPGCTREACSFQENLLALKKKNTVVIGVSRDSAKSHAGFKTKYNLSFPLLVDTDAALHRAYGAWGTKTMYGKTIEGALRTTVIIDNKGNIGAIFNNVKVDGHTAAVLAALDALAQ